MGIAPYNTFTFDGESSADYGVYLTGTGVFNAPERSVEMISIAGRNGAFALDRGGFENINVTYKVGMYDISEENFAQKVSAFRNWLCSKVSYVRLSDTYNSGEYRMAVYKNGFNLDHDFLIAGEAEITFECKPQRFLTSGEEVFNVGTWGNTTQYSGSLIEFDSADGGDALKTAVVSIDPIQSLNGYSSPWVGGAGKNLLKVTATTTTVNGVKYTVNDDGTVKAENTATSNAFFTVGSVTLTANTSYILNGCPSGGGSNKYLIYFQGQSVGDIGSGYTYTPTADETLNVRLAVYSGQTANYTFKPMVRLATVSDETFAPYENICPISGRSSVDTYVSPTLNIADATTYTTSLGTTVYGGTLDVVSGVLTVTYASYVVDENQSFTNNISSQNRVYFQLADMESGTYNTDDMVKCNAFPKSTASGTPSNTPNIAIGANSKYVYIQGVTGISGVTDLTTFKSWLSNNNVVFTYKLATPTTTTLTAHQVNALLGVNNVWSTGGALTIEVGHNPYIIVNPTYFDSLPLVKVKGVGTLGVGGTSAVITGTATQVIYIDCQAMEAYKNNGGVIVSANNLVSFSTLDFPKLTTGNNTITVGSGLSEVEITPRWWRV